MRWSTSHRSLSLGAAGVLVASVLAGTTAAAAPATTAPALGTVYVLGSTGSAGVISEFSGTATGNPTPLRSISGSHTGLSSSGPLAVGSTGLVYAATSTGSGPEIEVFAADASGNVAPTRTITGSKTDLTSVAGLAVAPNGELWVASLPETSGSGAALRYAATATGNVAPLTDITGTGHIDDPDAVAIYATAPSAPRDLKAKAGAKKVTLSWKAPATTGGAVTSYQVFRAAHSSGPWTAAATPSGTAATVTGLKAGTKYYFRVVALNDRGTSAASAAVSVKPS